MSEPAALLLTPGAGGDRTHHTLVAIEEAVAPLPTERVDLPRTPARAVSRVSEAAGELAARAEVSAADVALGGRSFGGRMCSMAVAEGLAAAGLVLLSYPLHPPGKPEQLRVEHFSRLDVPVLFVSGTRDPFGSPDELQSAANAIPGLVTFRWVEGGRHDPKGADDEIAEAVSSWLLSSPGRGTRRGRART